MIETPVVILAGGHGQRIGGGKAEQQLAGNSLLSHAIAKAASYSSVLAVSVRAEKQPLPGQIHLLPDQENVKGPIAGLAAALKFTNDVGAEHVLVIPCDTPFLPDDLLVRLNHDIADAAAAMPQYAGRLHPACSLWRTDSTQMLPEYFADGKRSLMGFAEAVGYAAIEWPIDEFDPFFNINTMEDLSEAEQILALLHQKISDLPNR